MFYASSLQKATLGICLCAALFFNAAACMDFTASTKDDFAEQLKNNHLLFIKTWDSKSQFTCVTVQELPEKYENQDFIFLKISTKLRILFQKK